MVRRRNLIILGIGLIVVSNVVVYGLGNQYISYSTHHPNGSLKSSGVYSVAIFIIPLDLVGFFLLMWGIFGRDFRGYPKAEKEGTQN